MKNTDGACLLVVFHRIKIDIMQPTASSGKKLIRSDSFTGSKTPIGKQSKRIL